MKFQITLAALCSLAAPALADLQISFDEGAPKDRFTFTNAGTCTLEKPVITLDLAGSSAGLIFDVTSKGAGIEVFQPFEVIIGRANLSNPPQIKDGDTSAVFALSSLAPNSSFAFTIDLDDTVSARGITVSGSEIAGAQVLLSNGAASTSAAFGSDARATLIIAGC